MLFSADAERVVYVLIFHRRNRAPSGTAHHSICKGYFPESCTTRSYASSVHRCPSWCRSCWAPYHGTQLLISVSRQTWTRDSGQSAVQLSTRNHDSLHETRPSLQTFRALFYITWKLYRTRMWANAKRDGRPAKHRWRPLFNSAKFGCHSLLKAKFHYASWFGAGSEHVRS